MRKATRKAVKNARRGVARCASKFEALQTAHVEFGTNTVRKMRDKMNHAGTHFIKGNAEFSTHVKGTQKRKGSSKPPRPL